MISQFRQHFGRIRPGGRAIHGAVLLGCLAAFACSEDRKAAADYDVAPRRLDLIPAGTVIGTQAPSGWSHLILKSHPRPAAGDFRELSEDSAGLAGLLFTALVADVKADSGRHHLERVAVGMGTRIGDRDTIITPETQKRLGADLGFIARIVLSTAQERLQDVQLIARSPTFALIDAPNLMLRQDRHRPVVLRYAVLVDEKTGHLETLLWLLDRDDRDGYVGPVGPMEWLPPSKIEDCVLHVDRREFTLGNPTERAFAMSRLPRGQRQIAFPESIRGLAARPRLSAAMAADLEAGLRAALKAAGR
jgi:hypothetical protein